MPGLWRGFTLMQSHIIKRLFPEQFREFPLRRPVMNLLRAIHILSFAALFGGIIFKQPTELLSPWVYAVAISGLLMFLIQLYASLIVLFEVQSLAVITKLVLLLFLPMLAHSGQVVLLAVIIIFSSLTSHANKRLRHRNLLPQGMLDKYGYHRSNSPHKYRGSL